MDNKESVISIYLNGQHTWVCKYCKKVLAIGRLNADNSEELKQRINDLSKMCNCTKSQ